MRKLILKMPFTLGGFVGGPDGESEDAKRCRTDKVCQAGAPLMERKTFAVLAGYWPNSSEFSRRLCFSSGAEAHTFRPE
jgi:hypothetical protein